jgi:Innexin
MLNSIPESQALYNPYLYQYAFFAFVLLGLIFFLTPSLWKSLGKRKLNLTIESVSGDKRQEVIAELSAKLEETNRFGYFGYFIVCEMINFAIVPLLMLTMNMIFDNTFSSSAGFLCFDSHCP